MGASMNRRTFGQCLVAAAGAVMAGQKQAAAASTALRVYFGAYTGEQTGSKGIYFSHFNSATGDFGKPQLATEAPDPSFLAVHPSGKYIYAVGESDGGARAYAVNADGTLKLINKVSSKGKGPCHLNVDATGHTLVMAYYDSGSVASFQIKDDGALSPVVSFIQHEGHSVDPARQKGPHAHSANFSPDNRHVLICDLGLDKVFVYQVNSATAELKANGFGIVPPGSGPRHLAFSNSGKHVLVNNEMLLTETCFQWDADKGSLTPLETVSVLPKNVPFNGEYSTAETRIHPSGKWVYVSVRTHDTIAQFNYDDATGKLTHVSNTPSGGVIPRNFNLDPSGRWLLAAHQMSGNVVLFEIDQATGALKPTGKEHHVGGCVCVRFLPAN